MVPFSGKRRGRHRRLKGRVFLGLAGAALALGLARLWGPLSTIRAQSDRLAQLGTTKANLLAEQADLERYKRLLATREGQEKAARRHGFVRPGERRLIFFREHAPEDETAGNRRDPSQPNSQRR